MLDLSTLKQALAPLSKVGRDEATFEVAGMTVTVRPLLPLEEVEVQRYAASVLSDIQAREGIGSDDQMGRAAALDYFDRFRIEIIAYSIVQVDGLDLRNVKSIATGEVLDNGVPVQVKRTMAMREIVEGWSRAMLTVCFARYGELVQKIADQADKVAQSTLPDLDAEIARVEDRLERLKEDRRTRAAGDPSVTAKQITNLIRAGEALERQAEYASDTIQSDFGTPPTSETEESVVEEPAAPPARKSVVPPTSPPPTSGPSPTYRASAPATRAAAPPDEVVSSFGDGSDPNALTAEEALIMSARAAAAAAFRKEAENPDPPHLGHAEPAGEVGGIEAYRLPSENLSPRGRGGTATQKASTPDPRGTENPNFKPPR